MYLQCALAAATSPDTSDANSAESLRARHAALSEALVENQFHEPLYIDSAESSGKLIGNIYAQVPYPFPTVNEALNGPAHWCDVLILHVNTKYCEVSAGDSGTTLLLNIGAKHEQPLEDSTRLEFTYEVVVAAPDYFQVQLAAASGPLGTRDYRILMEATALDNDETFVHFSYSYAYGLAGRLAMNAYLATTGRSKVGFTVVGQQPDGQPEYIRRVRGLVERNTMRYYLAIEAYLDAAAAPPADQFELRMQRWYAGTERYPRQLHEVDRAAYFEMKRHEYQRQQEAVTISPPQGTTP